MIAISSTNNSPLALLKHPALPVDTSTICADSMQSKTTLTPSSHVVHAMSTTIKLTQSKTPAAKTPAKPRVRQGRCLRYPYDNFSEDMIIAGEVINGTAKSNPNVKTKDINCKYNYGTAEKPEIDELKVEFPYVIKGTVISENAQSPSGVTEKKAYDENAEADPAPQQGRGRGAPPPKSAPKGTEKKQQKYRLICKLDLNLESHRVFVEIMRRIYVAYCKIVAKAFPGNKSYQMPVGEESEIDAFNPGCLRYILLHKYDETTETIVPGSPPCLDLSICPYGMYATRFAQITEVTKLEDGSDDFKLEYLKFDNMKKRGIHHIPRFSISSIFLGAQRVIRLQCSDVLVTRYVAGGVSEMEDTLKEIVKHGIVTEDVEILEEFADTLKNEEAALAARAAMKTREEDVDDEPEDLPPQPARERKPVVRNQQPARARRQPEPVEDDADLQEPEPEYEPEPEPPTQRRMIRTPATTAGRR